MALIAICGTDVAVQLRWSEMLRAAGHDAIAVTPASLCKGLSARADACLFDLGAGSRVDPSTLLAAVESCPNTPFVAMTARPEAQEGLRLLRAGLRGYCNRLLSSGVMDAVLATVRSGEIWAGRQVTDLLLGVALSQQHESSSAEGALLGQLTTREAEIAEQVAAGLSNKVIAIENGITERTVKAHLNSIFRKTGIRNRVQLALAVANNGASPRQLSSA